MKVNVSVVYKGFIGSIEHGSEEENNPPFYGSLQNVGGDCVLYHGDTMKEFAKSFKSAVDDYIDIRARYSVSDIGKITVM